MNENPTASDWTAARGEKWRDQSGSMEAMLKPLDEPLIGTLRLDAPYRIADVGCGAGGTSLEILGRAPAGSVIHGFDISPALIESARARKPSDESAIAFEVADIATTPAPEQRYERLVSRFGTMFFGDPLAAFRNLVGWLAPRGRFAFAVWGPLVENSWMTNLREVVAEIVELPPPDFEAPGPFRYAEVGKLLLLLDRAGLGELEVDDWRGALQIGGGMPAAEAANFALASSSIGEMVAKAGDQALNDARKLLAVRFSRHEQEGTVRMGASVHIVSGVRE